MDLSTLVPALERRVAPPGQFSTYFPDATPSEMEARLADALGEIQMDGFATQYSLDSTLTQMSPDPVPMSLQQLMVMYAMANVIQAQILFTKTKQVYKAGTVESDTEQASGVLQELLKEVNERKREFIKYARAGAMGKAFGMVDLYVTHSLGFIDPYWGNLAPNLGYAQFDPSFGYPVGY